LPSSLKGKFLSKPAQRSGRTEDESVDLVPKTWQLFRRKTGGALQEIASGVLA